MICVIMVQNVGTIMRVCVRACVRACVGCLCLCLCGMCLSVSVHVCDVCVCVRACVHPCECVRVSTCMRMFPYFTAENCLILKLNLLVC